VLPQNPSVRVEPRSPASLLPFPGPPAGDDEGDDEEWWRALRFPLAHIPDELRLQAAEFRARACSVAGVEVEVEVARLQAAFPLLPIPSHGALLVALEAAAPLRGCDEGADHVGKHEEELPYLEGPPVASAGRALAPWSFSLPSSSPSPSFGGGSGSGASLLLVANPDHEDLAILPDGASRAIVREAALAYILGREPPPSHGIASGETMDADDRPAAEEATPAAASAPAEPRRYQLGVRRKAKGAPSRLSAVQAPSGSPSSSSSTLPGAAPPAAAPISALEAVAWVQVASLSSLFLRTEQHGSLQRAASRSTAVPVVRIPGLGEAIFGAGAASPDVGGGGAAGNVPALLEPYALLSGPSNPNLGTSRVFAPSTLSSRALEVPQRRVAPAFPASVTGLTVHALRLLLDPFRGTLPPQLPAVFPLPQPQLQRPPPAPRDPATLLAGIVRAGAAETTARLLARDADGALRPLLGPPALGDVGLGPSVLDSLPDPTLSFLASWPANIIALACSVTGAVDAEVAAAERRREQAEAAAAQAAAVASALSGPHSPPPEANVDMTAETWRDHSSPCAAEEAVAACDNATSAAPSAPLVPPSSSSSASSPPPSPVDLCSDASPTTMLVADADVTVTNWPPSLAPAPAAGEEADATTHAPRDGEEEEQPVPPPPRDPAPPPTPVPAPTLPSLLASISALTSVRVIISESALQDGAFTDALTGADGARLVLVERSLPAPISLLLDETTAVAYVSLRTLLPAAAAGAAGDAPYKQLVRGLATHAPRFSRLHLVVDTSGCGGEPAAGAGAAAFDPAAASAVSLSPAASTILLACATSTLNFPVPIHLHTAASPPLAAGLIRGLLDARARQAVSGAAAAASRVGSDAVAAAATEVEDVAQRLWLVPDESPTEALVASLPRLNNASALRILSVFTNLRLFFVSRLADKVAQLGARIPEGALRAAHDAIEATHGPPFGVGEAAGTEMGGPPPAVAALPWRGAPGFPPNGMPRAFAPAASAFSFPHAPPPQPTLSSSSSSSSSTPFPSPFIHHPGVGMGMGAAGPGVPFAYPASMYRPPPPQQQQQGAGPAWWWPAQGGPRSMGGGPQPPSSAPPTPRSAAAFNFAGPGGGQGAPGAWGGQGGGPDAAGGGGGPPPRWSGWGRG
jgi:hypothetical protein